MQCHRHFLLILTTEKLENCITDVRQQRVTCKQVAFESSVFVTLCAYLQETKKAKANKNVQGRKACGGKI
ncbi:CLUMA_CG008331, isoform A [Clunio marinus]|uniref:CLUMA_CG008331, isoform A n=1 Tax=Clunio marinus TaxID=568069 RepID=A0A1J1I3G6_9DIPT|nr:CLUMA_CG008331, isoform A [Clunio marinus]